MEPLSGEALQHKVRELEQKVLTLSNFRDYVLEQFDIVHQAIDNKEDKK